MNKEYWNTIKSLARELRKNQTESEKILWKRLRNRKFHGLKFLRQHPLLYHQYGRNYFFIADFYCNEKKMVIELDGKIHDQQKDYDEQRDLIISQKGMNILRIENEIVVNNIDLALKRIEHSFLESSSPL